MIQTPFVNSTRYICCPACSKGEHAVSHLPAGTKTSWYCDECGARFRLHILSADQVECSVIPGERIEKTLVRLRSTRPVTIVVKGMRFYPEKEPETFLEQQRYYYEEHTCPTNFLGVQKVMDDDGDEDPHGIFAFVGAEPWVKKPDDSAVSVVLVPQPEPVDPTRLYDENGEWIGLRLSETITLEEFKKRYPGRAVSAPVDKPDPPLGR